MSEAKQKSSEFAWELPLARLTRLWLLPSVTLRRRLAPLAVGVGYIVAIGALGGLRTDHICIGMLCLLDFYNEKTRLFLRYFLPFILTGVIYDSMRYFYWQGIAGHVHVAGPYLRDLDWFGISSFYQGKVQKITPNEFFQIHTSIYLDLLCGFAYLVFVAEYLMTAFVLFFLKKFELLTRFGWSFLAVNLMGFITYFIYPAAPPWYVAQYGFGPARTDIHPNAAAAQRFDTLLGTHFFDQVYGRGVDVYGAYPSLHVAYPFLATCAVFKLSSTPQYGFLKWLRVPAALFYFLMCLSAVYLQHHYVVDILLGTSFSILCWSGLRWTETQTLRATAS